MAQGGSTQQTATTQAPAFQQPYQQYGLNQALSQYQNTGQLVAPFAPQQEQAMTNIGNLASGSDPTLAASQNYITNTLNGNEQQNPELNSLFTQGANQIQNQLASQFAGSGRNVGASAGVNAQALGTFGANLYGNAFNTEVGQQNAALSAAPQELSSQVGLQQALYGSGQNVQNQSQNYINAPQQFLQQYLNQANGNLGATQTTTPAFNATAGAVGGASLGANAGSTIGSLFGGNGGNYGTAIGGLLGGILGY